MRACYSYVWRVGRPLATKAEIVLQAVRDNAADLPEALAGVWPDCVQLRRSHTSQNSHPPQDRS